MLLCRVPAVPCCKVQGFRVFPAHDEEPLESHQLWNGWLLILKIGPLLGGEFRECPGDVHCSAVGIVEEIGCGDSVGFHVVILSGFLSGDFMGQDAGQNAQVRIALIVYFRPHRFAVMDEQLWLVCPVSVVRDVALNE